MPYDLDDRITDAERDLRHAFDAIRALALQLDRLLVAAEAAEWPCPVKGLDWKECTPGDLLAIDVRADAAKHAETVAVRDDAERHCMDRVCA